jgi:hypothetical protein
VRNNELQGFGVSDTLYEKFCGKKETKEKVKVD